MHSLIIHAMNMLSIQVLLPCILATTALVAHAQDCCPNGYFYATSLQTCYKYNQTPMSVLGAELSCIAENSHLASVTSAFEQSAINNYTVSEWNPAHTAFWIGLYDVNGAFSNIGNWAWTDGTGVSYTKWGYASNTPSSAYGCAVFYISGNSLCGSSTCWGNNLYSCDSALPFICKQTASPVCHKTKVENPEMHGIVANLPPNGNASISKN